MDCRSKKAALFFVACDANPDTRVKIPDAIRITGYSPSEAADRSLQMQVCRKADKIKGEAVPSVAASALLTLSTTANVGRLALRTITTVPAAVSAGWNITRGVRPPPKRAGKQCRAAKEQGAGGSAPVEECARVDDGERREQKHPLPTICRWRCGGGGHRPGSVDGNR